jgi:hypothetical protein
LRHVQVRLDDDLVDWFDENWGGNKQDFVQRCFERLRELVRLGEIEPPVRLVDVVVKEGMRT